MSSTQAGAKVSLHPVASRHGQQSSTVISVNLPTAGAGPRAGSARPGADKLARAPPPSPAASRCGGRPQAPSQANANANAGGEWGLQHPALDRYAVIDDDPTPLELEQQERAADEARSRSGPSPMALDAGHDDERAPPIRAMSASQLAELHSRYVALDVPHNVVFPFLHGVDGNIAAQNVFFGAPMSGQPTPNYRGLTIVRADMPTPEEEAALRKLERQRGNSTGSSSSEGWQSDQIGLGIDTRSRARASSMSTSQSMASSNGSSDGIDDADDGRPTWPTAATAMPIQRPGELDLPPAQCGRPRAMTSSTSSASMTSSTISGPSLFSWASSGNGTGSQTSFSSSSDAADDAYRGGIKGSAGDSARSRSSSTPYQAQPKHSVLNSTVFPAEILSPPTIRRVVYGRSVYGDLAYPGSFGDEGEGEVSRIGAKFVSPPQAAGVSLRNFKIQCAKYATISDIVVYCPAGYHPGALRLAQWFREAQDALWRDRQARGLGGLRYNVFVVTDPFDAFERCCPELVAVDGCGFSRNRVDFVDREREEMQRLTAASEIDDNVWLGCTGDLPGLPGSDCTDDEPLTPDEEGNPHCFAVCIEAHDAAASPNKARLAHANHFLDAIEATALFEVDSRQALRKLAEDDDGPWTDDGAQRRGSGDLRGGSLVLGPNGWTPVPCSGGLTNGSLNQHAKWRGQQAAAAGGRTSSSFDDQRSPLLLEPSSVIHMECPSTFQNCQSEQQVASIIEGILLLCAWIKKQAQPAATSSSAALPHRSRRVLLHCGDGYTETSVVALSYLMFSRGLSLPEAYLDLQLRSKRSFFVYARDLPFLKKVEAAIAEDRRARQALLAQEREADARARRVRHSQSKSYGGGNGEERFGFKLGLGRSQGSSRRSSMSSSASETNLNAAMSPAEQSVWARSLAAATGLVAAPGQTIRKATSNSRPSSRLPSRARTPTPKDEGSSTSSQASSEASRGPSDALRTDFRWFHDARFEGSFPSRILPFLYLGNLNHALNAHMLHALGITHVVSVGESAIAPPSCDVNGNRVAPGQHMSGSPNYTAHNSLYHEHAEGRISVLDLKNVSDDGIDPLRDTMRDAVEYIEAARRSGGKVLVHCRVGVSRSTTIVLAYVMAHLDLSLVESYLLVRSRRLNILIQPHLLFFWELRGWETFLAQEKARLAARLRKAAPRSVFESPDSSRTRQVHGGCISDAFTGLSVRSGRSEGSGSYRSASSSPCVSPLPFYPEERATESKADMVDAEELGPRLDVDLAAGAGSVYNFRPRDAALLPFGSGSSAGLPYASMRLLWGHFAREIADLNGRYFV
ncbi:uncharacterized protein PFL1_01054 [Pseudozyma flocculosa PF-1]|uniref:Related to protein tyrosine phosphatase PPS1 n=1 Tax=Pseudozyma flocculosa TaxID=84751 RepID=A0A5C3F8S3_9BASI|nr:uncharacterized protein PFL1_01054 [Pseudozyma flocculosa PF-1]EPQ31721.1 hypothetical protein PFL1_01054 [Pseudozyma flocculosa PF-1]SPO40838.1 related to protein tyrosine phosphatase PPS1 [Pseudozyma flocculosa]